MGASSPEKKIDNSNKNENINLTYNEEINTKQMVASLLPESFQTINDQLKSVCKIVKDNEQTGTGFLCKIPFPDEFNLLPVLITCYHVLGEEDIKEGKKINITFNNDEINKTIIIDKERKIYTSIRNEFDTTIIQIKENDKLNMKDFLDIDELLFKNDNLDIYNERKDIYLIHYPNGFKIKISFGTIKDLSLDKYEIDHLCSTEMGSSGCPIFNLSNFKIMGIHKGDHKKFNWKVGTALRGPIDYFNKIINLNANLKNENNNSELKQYKINIINNIKIKQDNKINTNILELKENNIISENKIFNNVISIDNIDNNNRIKLDIYIDENMKLNFNDIIKDNLLKLIVKKEYYLSNSKSQEKNYDLILTPIYKYIRNRKEFYDLESQEKNKFLEHIIENFYNSHKIDDFYIYNNLETEKEFYDLNLFKPKSSGIYNIELIFKNKINDCRGMFSGMHNITFIDLSSFDTRNVINMSDMFYYCYNLYKINLSSINTDNVKDMSYMFCGCYKLKNINLSSFNTKNVTQMRGMFRYCKSLENINLSFFNTENVTNIEYMFSSCYNLKEIDLSSFNTTNITNMRGVFRKCENLKIINLSSFNTKNVKYMDYMFEFCRNLDYLDLSSFNNKKTKKNIFIFPHLEYSFFHLKINKQYFDKNKIISKLSCPIIIYI